MCLESHACDNGGASNSYKVVSIYAQGCSVGMSGHYPCCLSFPSVGRLLHVRYLMAVSKYAHGTYMYIYIGLNT